MTRDDIIRMAREAHLDVYGLGKSYETFASALERFAALVAAAELRRLYELKHPRQWQGLTEDEVKGPIQRAMQHFGFDPTQYSLGGAATIGFLGLVKAIEAKLKEKNDD